MPRPALVAIPLALALGLTACGQGSSSTTSDVTLMTAGGASNGSG